MSAANDNGGPAFPVIYDSPGMTLRDWFAGQALAALRVGNGWGDPYSMDIATRVYAIADAMLAERRKEGAK